MSKNLGICTEGSVIIIFILVFNFFMFFFFFFFFEYGQAGFSAGHVKKIFLVLWASGIFIICQPLLAL